jgi:hypothetical protein
MNLFEREVKAGNAPRVNITRSVSEILSRFNGEDNPFPTDDIIARFARGETSLSVDEAVRLYQKGKRDRFAVAAIRDNVILNQALLSRAEMPPFGLVTQDLNSRYEIIEDSPLRILDQFSMPDPYSQLHVVMDQTLDAFHQLEIPAIENGERGALPYYASQRLMMWQAVYDYVPETENGSPGISEGGSLLNPPYDRSKFVGAGTGVRHKASLLRVIPQVVRRGLPQTIKLTDEVMYNAAVHNFHLISDIAMMDHDVASAVEAALYWDENTDKPYKLRPSCFELSGFENGIARIDYSSKVWEIAAQKLKEIQEKRTLTGEELTGGCPFMARVGNDTPAMTKFWNWSTDIAKYIYTTFEYPRLQGRG